MNNLSKDNIINQTELGQQPQSEFIPVLASDETIQDMSDTFNLDAFQVVRREFFAHPKEPALTFNDCKLYVNSACLAKFPRADYVQLLINPDAKILALRPCPEGTRSSFQWCSNSKGTRKPKQTTCTIFFAMLFTMMEWNQDYRYRMLGNVIRANGEYLIAFDLTSTETYQRINSETKKKTASRRPIYPEAWKDQFGLTYHEHQQSMLVNIFDGFAVYSIKDNSITPPMLAEQMPLQPNVSEPTVGLATFG